MTRIVPLRNGIPLTELLSNVFREFFDDADVFRTALLSYWPPNSKELASGLTTPPVCSQTTGLSPTFTSTFKLTRELICLSLSISNPNPIRLVMLMRILYLSLRPTNLSRRPTVPILRLHCDILQPLGLKYQASPFSTTTSTCLRVVCLYTLRTVRMYSLRLVRMYALGVILRAVRLYIALQLSLDSRLLSFHRR